MTTLTSAHDGFTLTAHRVAAVGPRRGGVVVIQEIFGVSDHVRERCATFAAAGYDAIAPSLFDRIEPGFTAGLDAAGFAKGRDAVAASPWPQVIADVQAAIDALAPPVFITGFCYGGAVAWLAAARCTGLAAASGFYGPADQHAARRGAAGPDDPALRQPRRVDPAERRRRGPRALPRDRRARLRRRPRLLSRRQPRLRRRGVRARDPAHAGALRRPGVIAR